MNQRLVRLRAPHGCDGSNRRVRKNLQGIQYVAVALGACEELLGGIARIVRPMAPRMPLPRSGSPLEAGRLAQASQTRGRSGSRPAATPSAFFERCCHRLSFTEARSAVEPGPRQRLGHAGGARPDAPG
jgi:hypothetical protein